MTLAPGDEVTWMVTRRQSHGGIRVSLREGEIVQIQNSMALVRLRNGRRLWLFVDELRKEGEKNAVTELFERLVEGISSAPAGEQQANPPDAGALGTVNVGTSDCGYGDTDVALREVLKRIKV